ncbi:hypothetical protein EVAR_37179_1 [Eumeta japonica]|uniref:Uncharacterized protein n=1 Tax=Eumeta variegata TaxID=151549 RepID=A0A4C1WII2_EUMVA|nr:hypothetical protein EVAR_37179_1 [Eumeta japonica]
MIGIEVRHNNAENDFTEDYGHSPMKLPYWSHLFASRIFSKRYSKSRLNSFIPAGSHDKDVTSGAEYTWEYSHYRNLLFLQSTLTDVHVLFAQHRIFFLAKTRLQLPFHTKLD